MAGAKHRIFDTLLSQKSTLISVIESYHYTTNQLLVENITPSQTRRNKEDKRGKNMQMRRLLGENKGVASASQAGEGDGGGCHDGEEVRARNMESL